MSKALFGRVVSGIAGAVLMAIVLGFASNLVLYLVGLALGLPSGELAELRSGWIAWLLALAATVVAVALGGWTATDRSSSGATACLLVGVGYLVLLIVRSLVLQDAGPWGLRELAFLAAIIPAALVGHLLAARRAEQARQPDTFTLALDWTRSARRLRATRSKDAGSRR